MVVCYSQTVVGVHLVYNLESEVSFLDIVRVSFSNKTCQHRPTHEAIKGICCQPVYLLAL